MKRLIALFLLWPALASAGFQCQPPGCFLLTSGSLIAPVNDVGAGSFSFADHDSSISGRTCFGMCLGGPGVGPFAGLLEPGSFPNLSFEVGSFGSLVMSGIAGGVSWDPQPPGPPPPFEPGNAELVIQASGSRPITAAGTFSATFTLGASIIGQPSTAPPAPLGCGGLPPCQFVSWAGAGRVTYTVVPFTNENVPPGSAFQVTKVTYTLLEPSTAALLLLGFAGVAVLGWRRRSHTTLLPAG